MSAWGQRNCWAAPQLCKYFSDLLRHIAVSVDVAVVLPSAEVLTATAHNVIAG